MREGRAVSGIELAVQADPLGEGRKRLNVGDFANAVKCFALARKRAETAQNIALLGWALYNDPTRLRRRRTQKGLELLTLAESMGGFAGEVQLLRARVELLEGDLVRAWNRLDRLHSLDPADEQARELLAQVRRALGR